MYSRKRPDSHRFMGGLYHVFGFDFKSLGTWLFSTTVTVVGTVAHQWRDLIIISSVRAHHLSSKYASFRHNLYQVLNTDTEESWHTLCVRLSNVCFCPPLHTPRSLHSRGQCPNARSLWVNLSPFFNPMFFLQYFFSLDATLKCMLLAVILSWFGHRPGYYTTLEFWFGLEHPSDGKRRVISQMSLSQYSVFGV